MIFIKYIFDIWVLLFFHFNAVLGKIHFLSKFVTPPTYYTLLYNNGMESANNRGPPQATSTFSDIFRQIWPA